MRGYDGLFEPVREQTETGPGGPSGQAPAQSGEVAIELRALPVEGLSQVSIVEAPAVSSVFGGPRRHSQAARHAEPLYTAMMSVLRTRDRVECGEPVFR